MAFCTNCGTRIETGRFCTSCGHPVEQTDSAPMTSAPTPPPAPPAATTPAPAATPASATMVNPFTGLDPQDLLRDVLSIVLALSALGIGWDMNGNGGQRWWVVIAALLTVASVALPYLATAKLVPQFTPAEARLGKVALNLPTFVSLLVVIINEFVHIDDPFSGGIGPAVGLLGAATVLAIQPRASEDAPGRWDEKWHVAGVVVASAVPVIAVVTWLVYLLSDGSAGWDDPLSQLGYMFLQTLAVFLLVTAVPLIGVLRRSQTWTRIYVTFAITLVVVVYLAAISDSNLFLIWTENFSRPLVGALWLIPPAAALLMSRPARRVLLPAEPICEWVATSRTALALATVGLAIHLIGMILLAIGHDGWNAPFIVYVILVILMILASALAHVQLQSELGVVRLIVAAIAAGSALAGIIAISVLHGDDRWESSVSWYSTAILVSLPALVAGALVIPRSIRTAFGEPTTPPVPGSPS